METMSTILSIITLIIAIAGVAGAALAFRTAKKSKIIELKDQTIDALQEQIAAIRDKQQDLEKLNLKMQNVVETIQAALKKKGILITVDGEMVSITEINGSRTSYHRTTSAKSSKKPPEEEE